MEQRAPNAASAGPVVRAEGLRKSFGALEVLREVGFEVNPGEIVCVWGPSGAGKSTLLHVVGLMTGFDGGRLELQGRDVRALPERERASLRNRALGFLFQFHHLLPDLSLAENAAMPLLIRGAGRVEALAKARALLDHLGLAARAEHRPAEASGGEQQRAALARALVGGPALLLADEPTGNLDRASGRAVEELLQQEAKSRGTAVILVTHNEELAARADRRLHLTDGVLR